MNLRNPGDSRSKCLHQNTFILHRVFVLQYTHRYILDKTVVNNLDRQASMDHRLQVNVTFWTRAKEHRKACTCISSHCI